MGKKMSVKVPFVQCLNLGWAEGIPWWERVREAGKAYEAAGSLCEPVATVRCLLQAASST